MDVEPTLCSHHSVANCDCSTECGLEAKETAGGAGGSSRGGDKPDRKMCEQLGDSKFKVLEDGKKRSWEIWSVMLDILLHRNVG